MSVAYDRIVRYGTPTALRVTVQPTVIESNRFNVALSRRYLHGAKLDHILPEPAAMRIDGEYIVFDFPVAGPAAPMVLEFWIAPRDVGATAADVRVGRNSIARINQWVLP